MQPYDESTTCPRAEGSVRASTATPPLDAALWCQVVQAAPVPLFLHFDAEQADVFLNEHLHRRLGYGPAESAACGSLAALVHPADRRRLRTHYAGLRAAGAAKPVELRLRAGDGSWHWYRAEHTLLPPAADSAAPRRWLGTLHDIGAERAARQRTAFYAAVLDNLPAGITVFGPEQRRRYANQRAGKLRHGRRAAEFRHAVHHRQEVAWEETLAQPAGAPAACYLRKFLPVLDAQQRVAYVIGYSVDISRRKATEQELARQQELVRQVVEASPSPIFVQDDTGQGLLANAAYARLRHQSVAELLAPSARPELPPAEAALLASGATVSLEERHQDGAVPAWYHTVKKAFAGPDGRHYLLSSSTDVTELKRARQAAEESARAKEVFLANMSHEIRTPMHGVVGLARLLKKTPVSAEQAEYLDLILSNASHLLVVINDILDFAKMEAGHLELEARPFDVAATVQDLVRPLALTAAGKGLRLRTELPPAPLPIVLGDAVRLRQVLVNLINNAIKFTPTGGITVAVTAVPAAEGAAGAVQLRFSITDTGIGISPDKLEQVFQSFAQASSNTARLYGGTGLGLAICRHLVELQGGIIGVESEPGRGSCFHFTVSYPPTELAPQAPPETSPGLPPGLLRGVQVLLVEDNPVNQLLACSLLQEWQAPTEVATDGEQALQRARAKRYDVILMDIQMPGMSGLDVTAALRREAGPNQHTPIVALTANALKTDVDTYPHAGFSDWLVKPYHEHSLYLVLARNTGRSAAAAAPPPAYGFEGLGKLANDPAFIRKLQQLYVDNVPRQLAQLDAALRAGDWATGSRLSHNLKSTFGNLQLGEALAGVKKMEELLKKNPDANLLIQLFRGVEEVALRMSEVFARQLQS
ncbi:hypothetical protein B0919_17365 [Hymenobacter sp. CRA2]|nr:hypothetical protein B0919_17365 [Hymenobacter sp. CRA2]